MARQQWEYVVLYHRELDDDELTALEIDTDAESVEPPVLGYVTEGADTYVMYNSALSEALEVLGDDGWELVCQHQNPELGDEPALLLKRPKESA